MATSSRAGGLDLSVKILLCEEHARRSAQYGFGCQGNVLRISLLCAATEPDADQDQGHFLESDVPVAAYIFNSPLCMHALGARVSAHVLQGAPTYSFSLSPLSLLSLFAIRGAPNVFLETIKCGEDDALGAGTGRTIVLRLYEALGGHAQAQLRVAGGLGVKHAYVTNLLEEAAEEEEVEVREEKSGEEEEERTKRGEGGEGGGVMTTHCVLNPSLSSPHLLPLSLFSPPPSLSPPSLSLSPLSPSLPGGTARASQGAGAQACGGGVLPTDCSRADGDIAVCFFKELMAKAEVLLGEAGEAQEVEVEWPLVLIVACKELDPWRAGRYEV
ncbi:hypothetical protein FB451DRAFT_1390857 [Mycena latifolia]|nr:hypothetical protein FB451DRAFT_1390857 [Mycena latifolia]